MQANSSFRIRGIFTLQCHGGGVAHVGICLAAVQAPKEGFLPVQIEAVGFEFSGAEAKPFFFHIQHLTAGPV